MRSGFQYTLETTKREIKMTEVRDILVDLGYENIHDHGKDYRMRPIYRESNNSTSLQVNKKNGYFTDYSAGIKGSLTDLIKITLKFDYVQAKQWISKKNINLTKPDTDNRPEIRQSKIFPMENLEEINPIHDYWVERGVSQETMETFCGGIVTEGRMKGRYVFPIFNASREIIGFTGRDITDKSKIKWKHLGNKSFWKYPLQVNYKVLKEANRVILVESVGDMLALWEAGLKNTMVTFGLDVSLEILNQLLRMDLDKITISFNNDENNNDRGNIAAFKARKKLLKYFDPNQVEIKLPVGYNDFGEMPKEKIESYFNG